MNVGAPSSTDPATSLLERFDGPGPRYTSYPTAVEFTADFGADALRARLEDLGRRDDDVALYVHLPFCRERCDYCACTVVATPMSDRVSRPYIDHVCAELDLVAEAIGRRVGASAVHLGGGTPTYHTPDELAHLVARLKDRFEWRDDCEASVEVDPRVTSPEHLEVLADLGFRRLSIGVQDFDPEVQRAIGRHQSVALTTVTVETARAFGFRSVNVDLVYGLPGQTPTSVDATLDAVLALEPERIASYSFAWLPKAFSHQRSIDAARVPRGAEKVRLLQQLRTRLLEAGYVDIGIDHFARPTDTLAIAQREGRLRRDFMGYTARTAPEYLAFGLSAIGFVGGAYVQNEKKLSRYTGALDAGRLPVARGVCLDDDDFRRAHVIGQLLCNFAVDKRAFEHRFGVAFDGYFAEDRARLAPLIEEGFVVDQPEAIEISRLGRNVARSAAMCFDRYRRSGPDGRFSMAL